MSKFTPGPWAMHAIDRLSMVYVVGPEPQNKFIAHMDDEFCDKDEQWANARLIAAVPELLEALKKLSREHQELLQEHYGHYPMNCIDYAFEAIAKAGGGE